MPQCRQIPAIGVILPVELKRGKKIKYRLTKFSDDQGGRTDLQEIHLVPLHSFEALSNSRPNHIESRVNLAEHTPFSGSDNVLRRGKRLPELALVGQRRLQRD